MPDPADIIWDANVFIALISNLNTPEAIENRDMCSRIIQQPWTVKSKSLHQCSR